MLVDWIAIGVGSGLSAIWLLWFITCVRRLGAFVGQPPKWFPYANTFLSALLLSGVALVPTLILRRLGEVSQEQVFRGSVVAMSILLVCYASSLITIYWKD